MENNNYYYIKRILFFLSLILIISSTSCTNELLVKTPSKVVKVVDGDTLIATVKGKEEKIRLIGIDTPESVHRDPLKNSPEGLIASSFTEDTLLGKEILLEFDVQERDPYGRLLAYIWLEDQLFNEMLTEEGYAQMATFPPNVKYKDRFLASQNRARKNKRGFWKNDFYTNQEKNKSLQKDQENTQSKNRIKGNTNSMIYHLPDGRDYSTVKEGNAVYFNTEEEAIKAGFRKAKQ